MSQDDPLFVMSMYANKQDLYEAKANYYLIKSVEMAEDVGRLAALCAALAADLPDTGDYCDFDSAVYASLPQHLCDLVDTAEEKLEKILKQ